MHQPQIEEREHPENAVCEQQRTRHPRNEHCKSERYRRCDSQEKPPVAMVEAMPLLQRGLGREPRVQQPVGYVKKPGAQRQCSGKPWRQPQPGRAPKSPAPQRSYSGCIQAQEVPITQQYVREAKQASV
jgi:hypothetical protein